MIRIGRYIIATENEIRDIVIETMPATIATRRAQLINRDLLAACMRADYLFHALRDRGLLGPEDQAVCDQLVAAIGAAIGAAPTQEAP